MRYYNFREYPTCFRILDASCIVSDGCVSGCGFDRELSPASHVPYQAHLLTSFLVAEAAESHRFFSRFRHEPCSLSYRLRVLTPGAFNHVPGKEFKFTQIGRASCRES